MTIDARKLLEEVRAVLWGHSRFELCKSIDAFLAQPDMVSEPDAWMVHWYEVIGGSKSRNSAPYLEPRLPFQHPDDRSVQTFIRADPLYLSSRATSGETWISVNDRLPTNTDWEEVLVVDAQGDMYTASYHTDADMFDSGERGWIDDVTHWMPLPSSPEVVAKEMKK